MPERIQKPVEPVPWGPKEGDGGGPRSPDISRPDTKDLLKKMRKVDPNQSKRYRQRTGQYWSCPRWRLTRIFLARPTISPRCYDAKECLVRRRLSIQSDTQRGRTKPRGSRRRLPRFLHSSFPVACSWRVIGVRLPVILWSTIAPTKCSK